MQQELEKPDGIDAEDAIEIIRAWIANGQLQLSLRSGVAESAEDWGDIIIAIAQYADLVLHQEKQCGMGASIEGIRARFNQRLDEAIYG